MAKRLAIVALLCSFGFTFQGCALIQPPPQNLVTKGDHAGLANYYKEQAQELRDNAKVWDTLALSYERHGDPHGKIEPAQHAAHCRAVAASYRKAADEADVLATEHRQQLPHGVMQ